MSPRLNVLLATLLLLAFSVASYRLGVAERQQYVEEIHIGAMPAWLVLPGPAPGDRFGPPAPLTPVPPLVIVQHGFSASRQAMAPIARGLARNGFAVLAADFRGHGQNPTPFDRDGLDDDIANLLAYARTRPELDATRVALVGHSMGAMAVYAYASRHGGIDAVIPISGSASGGDARQPRNVLLFLASGDPQRLRDGSLAALTRLMGGANLPAGSRFGDFAVGTARELIDVPGNDHVTILFSDLVVRRAVEWLRGTWGLAEQPFVAAPPTFMRQGLIAVFSGLLLFFPLAPFMAAGLMRVRPIPGTSPRGALRMTLAAVVVAGSALYAGTPLSFLPYAAGNQLLSFLLIAGAIYGLWISRHRPDPESTWGERGRAAILGLTAFALIYATVGIAASRLFFNLTLSPQRAAWFVPVAVLLLPLGVGFEAALRPRGGGAGIARSLIAKAVLLGGMVLAIYGFGTLPPVIGLMVPSFAIVLPIVEAVAARLYTASGSVVASGVLTSLMLAWLPAAIFPIG